jgi:hypothetical protein
VRAIEAKRKNLMGVGGMKFRLVWLCALSMFALGDAVEAADDWKTYR